MRVKVCNGREDPWQRRRRRRRRMAVRERRGGGRQQCSCSLTPSSLSPLSLSPSLPLSLSPSLPLSLSPSLPPSLPSAMRILRLLLPSHPPPTTALQPQPLRRRPSSLLPLPPPSSLLPLPPPSFLPPPFHLLTPPPLLGPHPALWHRRHPPAAPAFPSFLPEPFFPNHFNYLLL